MVGIPGSEWVLGGGCPSSGLSGWLQKTAWLLIFVFLTGYETQPLTPVKLALCPSRYK